MERVSTRASLFLRSRNFLVPLFFQSFKDDRALMLVLCDFCQVSFWAPEWK